VAQHRNLTAVWTSYWLGSCILVFYLSSPSTSGCCWCLARHEGRERHQSEGGVMRGRVNPWFSIRAGQNYHCGTANDTPQGPGSPGGDGQEGGGVGSQVRRIQKQSMGTLNRNMFYVGPGFSCHYLKGCTFEKYCVKEEVESVLKCKYSLSTGNCVWGFPLNSHMYSNRSPPAPLLNVWIVKL